MKRRKRTTEGFQCYACWKVFKQPIDFYGGERFCPGCLKEVQDLHDFMHRVSVRTGRKGKVLISVMPKEYERVSKLRDMQNHVNQPA